MHIMLGQSAKQVLCDMKKYVIKYGSQEENHYFSAMLYSEEEDQAVFSLAEASEVDESTFISGIENLFCIETKPFATVPHDKRQAYIQDCFARLYDTRLTINDPGDAPQMHACIYLPLYDTKYWQLTCEMLDAIEHIRQQYIVDLFLVPADLAFLFDEDVESLPTRLDAYHQQTVKTIHEVLEAQKKYPSLGHLVLMQNCNSNGVSLDLDEDSFVRIAGEYALQTVGHYAEVYNLTVQDNNRPIHALGLSVLSFDKYYFVQYLLHKAYLYILDREQIMQEQVDVNKVSQIVQGVLANNVNVFSAFYHKHVEPQLLAHTPHEEIIASVRANWDVEIERLTNECQSYIDDPSLTLPEKQAALAQLLGEDDELLSGYLFNRQQLVIDDCSREVLDYFVRANNRLAALYEPIESGDSDTQRSRKQRVNDIADYGVLSPDHEAYPLPSNVLDELKSIKVKVRESSNYIRSKSQELAELEVRAEEHEQAQKRLTEDGFVFEGRTYLLQSEVIERPCEEDYEPIENHQSRVDLRQYFSAVRDQGSLGSCSTFTMVSIYEYILRKNNALDSDLSEAFVYYNVRQNSGNPEEEGTSLYDNIKSMGTLGVCIESLCPYTDKFGQKPSDEAYQEAAGRLVKKALNVRKNIEHIKSAVAQGYPVAVSLRIYDSFAPVNGFISRPTEEEVANSKSGNHAMVVCGYSDDERVFIVRNSWGTRFGENGYCYIPYSYVEDFLNVACIITEVSVSDVRVEGNDTKTIVAFDLTNSKIKAAILRNLIAEEKRLLAGLNAEYRVRDLEYNSVFQALGNNSTRIALCEGTERRLRYQNEQAEQERVQLEAGRIEELHRFDKATLKGVLRFAGSWLTFITTYVFLLWPLALPVVGVLTHWASYSAYVAMLIDTIYFILWYRQRHHKRVELDDEYKTRLEALNREMAERERQLEVLNLRSHLAGMIIDSLYKLFNNLHSKYSGMRSFVGNLRVWREEEGRVPEMSDQVSEPFLSVVSNEQLNRYFDECKQEITRSISLSQLFRNTYSISDEDIIRFQNNLKRTLVAALFQRIEDFSMYKFIIGSQVYPYVELNSADLDGLLGQMDNKSNHFVRTLSSVNSVEAQSACAKLLFMDADFEKERARWDKLCNHNFQTRPLLCHSNTSYRLTLMQIDGLALEQVAILQ